VQKMVSTFSALAHSKQTGPPRGPRKICPVRWVFWPFSLRKVNSELSFGVEFLVLLNINLAFINILPFPCSMADTF